MEGIVEKEEGCVQSYLTLNNLEVFVMTLLAICWAVSMLLSARTGIRKAREESRAPLSQMEEDQKELRRRIDAVELRLTDMELRSDDNGNKTTLVLRSQLSILSHLVNGNSLDKLKQSLQEINDYLLKR